MAMILLPGAQCLAEAKGHEDRRRPTSASQIRATSLASLARKTPRLPARFRPVGRAEQAAGLQPAAGGIVADSMSTAASARTGRPTAARPASASAAAPRRGEIAAATIRPAMTAGCRGSVRGEAAGTGDPGSGRAAAAAPAAAPAPAAHPASRAASSGPTPAGLQPARHHVRQKPPPLLRPSRRRAPVGLRRVADLRRPRGSRRCRTGRAAPGRRGAASLARIAVMHLGAAARQATAAPSAASRRFRSVSSR